MKADSKYKVVIKNDTDNPENNGSVIYGPTSEQAATGFLDGVEYVNDSALTVELIGHFCDESEFAHWGETKESMRRKAISLFERLLERARNSRRFPQDGSKGQAEQYHIALLKSLEQGG